MKAIKIDNTSIQFGALEMPFIDELNVYLNKLSEDSKKRFGPHLFTKDEIVRIFNDNDYKLFIARNPDENSIIAYTIIKFGWLDFEIPRLTSYGLSPGSNDCTIAPSVADEWQGRGLGSMFFDYLMSTLKKEYHMSRIILWGGVQSNNSKAIRLYEKFGFKTLGEFNYNGMNLDMILEIPV